MKLRAAVLSALTILGLGLVVLVSPAQPAWACSCALPFQQMDERADLIVVGTVTEVTDTRIRLSVESVENGSPPAASSSPGTTPTLTTAADAPAPSPSRWWVAGGASPAVLAAGLAGLFLWRRRTG